MRRALEAVCYVVPAVIHLLPLYGLLGAEALTRLYGLEFADPSLQVLMRHRAVLFGVVGGLLLAAALRPVALLAGFASVVSYFALAYGTDGANAHVLRVAAVDWLAFACLAVAAVLRRGRPPATTA
jgi:hypothetical protein